MVFSMGMIFKKRNIYIAERLQSLEIQLLDMQNFEAQDFNKKSGAVMQEMDLLERELKSPFLLIQSDALRKTILEIMVFESPQTVFIPSTVMRPIVFVNVLDTVQAFYQSSEGTDGKIMGNWYPFYGVANNWIVKDSGGSDWVYNALASKEHQLELKRIAIELNTHLDLDAKQLPFVYFENENQFNNYFGSHIPIGSSIYYFGSEESVRKVQFATYKRGWNCKAIIQNG